MNGETIRTITIRGRSEGLDKLTADINKLVTAEQSLAIVSEEAGKKHLSLEAQWKRQTLRLDEVARAQANVARETKLAKAALDQNLTDQAGYARQLELINQRYGTATTATQTYGKAVQQGTGEVRLARHELINLSRQFQDVGVSLASGQAPLTVLIQQGSQIADVFATSSGTLRGFFGQMGAGAARFLGSTAGIVTSVGAIGTALLAVGSSAASAQRDIEKALSGIAAASGATRDQINKIAEGSSSALGISPSEAREAATAFAATGKIYGENIAQATRMVDAYARAGGNAADVTKMLAEALQDPAKGALDLNKKYGGLNVAMLENIRILQAQGKHQEAQKALMDGMLPAIEKQAQYLGFWSRAWNALSNQASAAYDVIGKGVLTLAEGVTGADFGARTPQEQLGSARERVSSLQERIGASGSAMQAAVPQSVLDALKEAEQDVRRLERAVDDLNKKAAESPLKQLGLDAKAAADGFLPLQAQLRATEQQLNKLREAEAAGIKVDPAAIAAGEVRKLQQQQQAEAAKRQVQYTQQLAALYPGMSIEGAKQLHQATLQSAITEARTPHEKKIAEANAEQFQMLLAGVAPAEALRITAEKRGVAEKDLLQTMEKQNALATQRAISGQVTERTTDNLADAAEDVADKTWSASRGMASYADNAYRAAAGLGTIASELENSMDMIDSQFGGKQYTSTVDPLLQELRKSLLERTYGAGNIELRGIPGGVEYWAVKPEFLQNKFDELRAELGDISKMDVSSPAAIQRVFSTVLGKGFAGGLGDVNRLLGIVSDPQQQASLIQQTIDRIQATEPPSLARQEMINELNSKLEQLANSTDSLNSTMQNALSPYYSQDPRTTKLGFRAGVTGNPDWMTGAGNTNPLVAVLGQGATAPGMANGGSFTVGGGYSANDNRMALFPVASGEQVVVNRTPQRGGQVVNIDNRIFITGSVDADALSKMKVSRYQQSQRMRAGLVRGS